jgi:uncharacterized membrane protein YczE
MVRKAKTRLTYREGKPEVYKLRQLTYPQVSYEQLCGMVQIVGVNRAQTKAVIDALLTGNFVQAFNSLNPFPENDNLWIGIGVMLIGFVFMALGMWIYMSAEQCCGPRDSLLVGLGKRLPNIPIGIVEVMLWAAVLLAGWLLGGPIGIGTLISTFGAGLVMQVVYNLLKFEPRQIRHRDVLNTMRILFSTRTEGV